MEKIKSKKPNFAQWSKVIEFEHERGYFKTLNLAAILLRNNWKVFDSQTIYIANPRIHNRGTHSRMDTLRSRSARQKIVDDIRFDKNSEYFSLHGQEPKRRLRSLEKVVFPIQTQESHILARTTKGFVRAMEYMRDAGSGL